MFDFFDFISNTAETMLSYFDDSDSYFEEIFVWLQVWYIKMKLEISIMFVRTSYLIAVGLLDEIGFNSIFSDLFNQLPSELRYYGNLFKVPQGFGIWANCATTSLVMRMSR